MGQTGPVRRGASDYGQILAPSGDRQVAAGLPQPFRYPTSVSLAQRLAALTVAFAILLVLGTTEFTLSWSARSRLDDLRNESEALAETWTAYLNRAAPTGDSAAVVQALASWPNQHITETSAAVFRARGSQLVLLAGERLRAVGERG